MRSSLRVSAVAAIAVGVVLTLTSCTPATFVWGYVGAGSDLGFAFCESSTATSARIAVSARSDGQLEEVQSTEWSGPRIFIPEGAILASGSLPGDWEQTDELDLSAEWERIDVELYDGERYVGFGTLEHRDADSERWSLSPAPSLLTGTPDCDEPFEHRFEQQP